MKRITILLSLLLAIAVGAMLYAVQALPVDWASAQGIVEEVPFAEAWAGSGHNDADAEAFVHWDEDGEISERCAKCHSTTGYQDFHGLDGSAVGEVSAPAPIGETVTCVACHNEATVDKDSVVMPSGIELTDLGPEAVCMECHQGRQSKISVDASIEESGVDDDTVSEDLGFANIHYYAAAATKFGTLAKGGYEYDDKSYDGKFAHVDGFEDCTGCHDSHTLELDVAACTDCHEGVTTAEDFRDVRMAGSLVDYDGDGDVEEGIYYEMEGMREVLYDAILTYAADVAGEPIAYGAGYPYFFIDTDDDGAASESEMVDDGRYNAWTPRLLKAAYNYQTSLKDPGAYAHGGKYIIQLMYDSIEDLDPTLVEGMRRIDHGHFAGSEEAFRHWDEDDPALVEADCVRCHSAEGLPMYLENNATIAVDPSNGFQCSTCHNDVSQFTLYEVNEVEFPSGAMVAFEVEPESNLCITCHQGRNSTPNVNEIVAGMDEDTPTEELRFQNIHYFAAGATLFGDDVQGAYQYEGREYFGRFLHDIGVETCTGCHNAHELTVQVDKCSECHDGIETLEDTQTIREYSDDWDGDGDTTEGIAGELDTLSEMLYVAIQDYAADTVGTPIVYESHSYPYFFIDTNADGEPDDDEAVYPNQYNAWTPRLLKAAYNYQYAQKDPGAFAHNGQYVIQVLHDSLADLGEDTSGLTRP